MGLRSPCRYAVARWRGSARGTRFPMRVATVPHACAQRCISSTVVCGGSRICVIIPPASVIEENVSIYNCSIRAARGFVTLARGTQATILGPDRHQPALPYRGQGGRQGFPEGTSPGAQAHPPLLVRMASSRCALLPAPGVEQASCWAQKTGPHVRTMVDEGCVHGCGYALCLCHRPLWGLRMVEGLHHVVTQAIQRYNLLVYGLAPLEEKGASSSCMWGRSSWSSIGGNLG